MWLVEYLLNFVFCARYAPSLVRSPCLGHSCPGYLLYEQLQCALHVVTIEEYVEATACEEHGHTSNFGCSKDGTCNTSMHELHWVSICFWAKIKVLITIFKTLHGIGPCYLRNCLTPIIWTHSPGQAGKVCYRLHQLKINWLSLLLLPFGIFSPWDVFLVAFQKGVKTWLFQLLLGSQSGMQCWACLAPWKSTLTQNFLTFNLFNLFHLASILLM